MQKLTQSSKFPTALRRFRPSRLLPLSLLAVVLSACSGLPSYAALHPATTQGNSMYNLWQGSMTLGLGIGIFVWGLILYSVFKFKKKGNSIPSQTQYHIPLEITYTVIPILIVVGLFYFTIQSENKVDKIVPNPAVKITVTAFQWGWRFNYPKQNITIATTSPGSRPTLVIPTNVPVRINLVSSDVIHSFYVPKFLFKRQAIPGVKNTFDFNATKPGTYFGECSEFCGLHHDNMLFNVKAVTPSVFKTWLASNHGKVTA